jgi:CRP-like cAMP-binding protein
MRCQVNIQATSPRSNRLLSSLSDDDFKLMQPLLEPVRLVVGDTLIEPDTPILHIYFPEDGVVSAIRAGSNGRRLEVGVVGREGLIGTSILLNCDHSPLEAVVQLAGHGHRIATAGWRNCMSQSLSLRDDLLPYVQAFSLQVCETAAANAYLTIEVRLARWILMCQDRVESIEIALTHEYLSIMLGVQRPGVTLALHSLEGLQLIRNRRGTIIVRDRVGLCHVAGDSYGSPEAEFERLFARSKSNGAGERHPQ